MKKILINFAHPTKRHSHINKALIKAVKDLEHVTVNDLYANYPDFLIDIKREQKLCEKNDIIIFQHPLHWYSAPSIMKEWLDLVLEHGWAYGSHANALKDKIFFQAISAGRDEEIYDKEQSSKFSLREFISPFEATANMCQMIWMPPFAIFGAHTGLEQSKIDYYAKEYKRIMVALRDETLDLKLARKNKYLNSDLDLIIKG